MKNEEGVNKSLKVFILSSAVIFCCVLTCLQASNRLSSMPGYERYQEMRNQIRGSVVPGSLSVTWAQDSNSFEYRWDGKRYRYDITTRKAEEIDTEEQRQGRRDRGTRGTGRGGFGRISASFVRTGEQMPRVGIVRRQTTRATSPDGKYRAFSRDGNVYLGDPNGDNEIVVTTDGSVKKRLRYGVATIIYGEELGMAGGIFWSPDSKKFAYYCFDESEVPDYYVHRNETEQYNSVNIDPYPKAGVRSPEVNLYIYDINENKSIKVDVRDGKPFEDSVVGYYVYRIYWSPGGGELLFHRMNRKQDIMEFAAANPETGKCRVIVHEEWLPSWVDWTPTIYFLEDGKRFIWSSDRTGFRNYYLYDMNGQQLATITNHPFEVAGIERIDEERGLLYYTARDGDNHMKVQLHKAGLDGKNDVRLTDPAFNHRTELSPDGKYFIDIAQTHYKPPVTRLMDSEGKIIDKLADSNTARFEELALKKVELFTFTAADGNTTLHGMLHFPSRFDPNKQWPLLVDVYGGPITNAARESFTTPNPLTEYGFLIASFDSRSAAQRGKSFIDAFYGNLGIVEMDDQAEGVKELVKRPYVDKTKVGVFGMSYGGTSAATLLMRFPEIFKAACSSSPVTDYRNYNNIYSERYEGLVADNEEGYDKARVMTYVDNLEGRLMLFYGTADNNVHPSNSLQLIRALQRARKSFELQVGPDMGHTAINRDRMMEFFIENLILN